VAALPHGPVNVHEYRPWSALWGESIRSVEACDPLTRPPSERAVPSLNH